MTGQSWTECWFFRFFCPLGDTWYGVILWVLELTVRALRQSEQVIFRRGFSVCCAVLISHKNGETAVCDYNPALFWVLSMSCLMSCKVNFNVIRSALQNECVYFVVLLIMSSIDPTFCGIFVCGPLQFKCVFLTSSKLIHSMFQRVTFEEYSTIFYYYLIPLILLFSLLFSF